MLLFLLSCGKQSERHFLKIGLHEEPKTLNIWLASDANSKKILSLIYQPLYLRDPETLTLIPWLADGRFPTDMAINTLSEQEEERRVFHVAVTRAKDELYLVMPQTYRGRSRKVVMMKPSRFLSELDESLTERLELEEDLPHLNNGHNPKVE